MAKKRKPKTDTAERTDAELIEAIDWKNLTPKQLTAVALIVTRLGERLLAPREPHKIIPIP